MQSRVGARQGEQDSATRGHMHHLWMRFQQRCASAGASPPASSLHLTCLVCPSHALPELTSFECTHTASAFHPPSAPQGHVVLAQAAVEEQQQDGEGGLLGQRVPAVQQWAVGGWR